MEGDLSEALDAGARNHEPTPLRRLVAAATRSAAESDLGRWLHSGARLLTTARARLVAAEHEHAVGRAKIIADAQRQLAELQTRYRDELRRFDADHEALMTALREDIERMENMQEAGQWPAT